MIKIKIQMKLLANFLLELINSSQLKYIMMADLTKFVIAINLLTKRRIQYVEHWDISQLEIFILNFVKEVTALSIV